MAFEAKTASPRFAAKNASLRASIMSGPGFPEAGKRRLAGDIARAATSDEVKTLRREATVLKEVIADLTLENRLLKKSMIADGGDEE